MAGAWLVWPCLLAGLASFADAVHLPSTQKFSSSTAGDGRTTTGSTSSWRFALRGTSAGATRTLTSDFLSPVTATITDYPASADYYPAPRQPLPVLPPPPPPHDPPPHTPPPPSPSPPSPSPPPVPPTSPSQPLGHDLSATSATNQQLYWAINTYRAAHNLPAVPYSTSMQFVADTHTTDLVTSDNTLPANCLPHSWFSGPYECCMDGTQATGPCMWDKPIQLTSYTGLGFEILTTGYGPLSSAPNAAVRSWAGSPEHNNVILNIDPWVSPWQALACSIKTQAPPYQGLWVAVCWFGNVVDVASGGA